MRKYENFCRALTNLKEIETKEPPFDTITTTGMVALKIIAECKEKFIALFESLKKSLTDNRS